MRAGRAGVWSVSMSMLGMLLCASDTLDAMFMRSEVDSVPLDRVIANLTRLVEESPNDAALHGPRSRRLRTNRLGAADVRLRHVLDVLGERLPGAPIARRQRARSVRAPATASSLCRATTPAEHHRIWRRCPHAAFGSATTACARPTTCYSTEWTGERSGRSERSNTEKRSSGDERRRPPAVDEGLHRAFEPAGAASARTPEIEGGRLCSSPFLCFSAVDRFSVVSAAF
jgi:hypothetical protein